MKEKMPTSVNFINLQLHILLIYHNHLISVYSLFLRGGIQQQSSVKLLIQVKLCVSSVSFAYNINCFQNQLWNDSAC